MLLTVLGQALQVYQIRQLVELALFNSSGGADRSMGMFIDWARPFVASVQHSIDQRLPRCALRLSACLEECLSA